MSGHIIIYHLYQGTNKLIYYYCWWEQQELRSTRMAESIGAANLCRITSSWKATWVIKSKMGTIKSKIGKKIWAKKKSKMGKRKSKFGQGLPLTPGDQNSSPNIKQNQQLYVQNSSVAYNYSNELSLSGCTLHCLQNMLNCAFSMEA